MSSTEKEIRKANREADRHRKKEEYQRWEEKQKYEKMAYEVHGEIGGFIKSLRSKYATRGMQNESSVTIKTGKPSEWGDLPDIAADFLGKKDTREEMESLTIVASELDNKRTMVFYIGNPLKEGDVDRWISVSATKTGWHTRSVAIDFQSHLPLETAPESIISAYYHGKNFHENSLLPMRNEMLSNVRGLVAFGRREAIKEIKTGMR